MPQFYIEGADANFIVKSNKLASSVGTEYDVSLSRITVIPDLCFSMSGRGVTDRV